MSVIDYVDGHTYQVSELQRDYRSIVGVARAGAARIRDKDGMTLVLAPAADVDRGKALIELMRDLIQLEHALRLPREQRHVTMFGRCAWAQPLTDEALQELIHELGDALLAASSTGSMSEMGDLLYSWRATAAIEADPELAEHLRVNEDQPLTDVEL